MVADTLGLQNQWGMHKILQFENCLETKLKTTPREILAIPQSRYYKHLYSIQYSIAISVGFASPKRGLASHLTKSAPVGAFQLILGNETYFYISNDVKTLECTEQSLRYFEAVQIVFTS